MENVKMILEKIELNKGVERLVKKLDKKELNELQKGIRKIYNETKSIVTKRNISKISNLIDVCLTFIQNKKDFRVSKMVKLTNKEGKKLEYIAEYREDSNTPKGYKGYWIAQRFGEDSISFTEAENKIDMIKFSGFSEDWKIVNNNENDLTNVVKSSTILTTETNTNKGDEMEALKNEILNKEMSLLELSEILINESDKFDDIFNYSIMSDIIDVEANKGSFSDVEGNNTVYFDVIEIGEGSHLDILVKVTAINDRNLSNDWDAKCEKVHNDISDLEKRVKESDIKFEKLLSDTPNFLLQRFREIRNAKC